MTAVASQTRELLRERKRSTVRVQLGGWMLQRKRTDLRRVQPSCTPHRYSPRNGSRKIGRDMGRESEIAHTHSRLSSVMGVGLSSSCAVLSTCLVASPASDRGSHADVWISQLNAYFFSRGAAHGCSTCLADSISALPGASARRPPRPHNTVCTRKLTAADAGNHPHTQGAAAAPCSSRIGHGCSIAAIGERALE